jgi:hypothetical protein
MRKVQVEKLRTPLERRQAAQRLFRRNLHQFVDVAPTREGAHLAKHERKYLLRRSELVTTGGRLGYAAPFGEDQGAALKAIDHSPRFVPAWRSDWLFGR